MMSGNMCVPRSSKALTRNAYMRSVSILLFMTVGFFYGLSPLVLPVAQRFTSTPSSHAGGIFLYGFAMLLFGLDIVGTVEIVMLKKRPHWRFAVLTSAILTWPISIVVLALAVELASEPLFFVSFLAMSYPMGTIGQYLLHAELPMVWGEQITTGSAIAGTSVGCGAFFWTLSMGELTHLIGADHVSTVIGISAFVFAVLALAVVFFENPARELPCAYSESTKNCVKGEASFQQASVGEILKDWRSHACVCVINGFIFCGLSMKLLLTTIFEEALGLTYIQATRMSAFCLLAYVPGRGLTPFFATKNKVFGVFISVLGVETIAYAISPWAISLGSNGTHRTAALLVYSCLRLISGGGFAILLGNIGVLFMRVFGKEKIPAIVTYWSLTEWIVGLGPSFAWVMHVESAKSSEGHSNKESFNTFFYLCSGIAGLACAGVIGLSRASPERSARDVTGEEATRHDVDSEVVGNELGDHISIVPVPIGNLRNDPSGNSRKWSWRSSDTIDVDNTCLCIEGLCLAIDKVLDND